MITIAAILFLSYLAGSVPGSLWVGRLIYGVDLRKHGSGNPGATNAYRILGWKAGVLSTLIDMGKGFVAARLISQIRIDALPDVFTGSYGWLVLALMAGVAAVFGHMFPVFARFKGGKGVNTAAGILLAVTPLNMLITFLVFCVVLWATRFVSLSSMLAAITYPVSLVVQKYALGDETIHVSLVIFGILMALVIIIAHKSNIKRLIAGNENRISWVKSPVTLEKSSE